MGFLNLPCRIVGRTYGSRVSFYSVPDLVWAESNNIREDVRARFVCRSELHYQPLSAQIGRLSCNYAFYRKTCMCFSGSLCTTESIAFQCTKDSYRVKTSNKMCTSEMRPIIEKCLSEYWCANFEGRRINSE